MINKRKNYYLVVDVETANGMGNPLAYDIGLAISDTQGNVYEKWSYVVQEIFFDERKIYNNPMMMNTAYYSNKLPLYYDGIFNTKTFTCKSIRYIKKVVENACKKYNVKAICAYNAQFDTRSLRDTIRYITKSKTAEFFPTDIPIYDIWGMACESIAMTKKYHKFCIDNDFVSDAENCRTSAEVVYRFLTNNATYEECHTGLEDVLIESFIMAECLKKHVKLSREVLPMPWKIPQEKFKKTLAKC